MPIDPVKGCVAGILEKLDQENRHAAAIFAVGALQVR